MKPAEVAFAFPINSGKTAALLGEVFEKLAVLVKKNRNINTKSHDDYEKQ